MDGCLVPIRREPLLSCDLLHCCSGSAACSLTSLLIQGEAVTDEAVSLHILIYFL